MELRCNQSFLSFVTFDRTGGIAGHDTNSNTPQIPMKSIIRSLIISGLLLGGAAFVRAEDAAVDAKKTKGVAKEEVAKKRDEAANLTPEQREVKRKEMAEKRAAKLKELQAKKAAGTLTEKETTQLERLEKGPGKRGQQEKKAEKK